eukprot:6081297-Alexandrium_andersonii.AAC.1
MGLLEVVPEPPAHDTNSIDIPPNTEYVNINGHPYIETQLNTNLKHSLNTSTSGKGPPSSR